MNDTTNIKKLLLLFALLPLVFALGCGNRFLKGYDAVSGKSFVLERVFFYQKGANAEIILHQMKEMELPKLMRLLEHRYGISIDTSEYDLFLLAEEPSKIKVSGLLSDTDFLWEASEATDRIEFECRQQETESGMDLEKEFKLKLYASGKRAAVIYGTFIGASLTLPEAAAALGYRKAKDIPGDVYTDTLSKRNIDINALGGGSSESPELAEEKFYVQKISELKAKIKEHIYSLPPFYRERYKRAIIEYLNAGK